MKKSALVVLVLALCFSFAYANEAVKDKLVVGVEYNSGKKNIENLNVVQLGLGDFLGASLVLKTDDVKVNQYLTTIGYKVSDNLIPYAILGYSNIGLDQSLNGSITLPWFSDSIDLTQSEIKQGALTYGLGANGKLAEIKGITIGYDARYLMANLTEKDQSILLLSDIALNDTQKLDYAELDLSIIASKEIAIKDNKIVKAITPYVGYQFSQVNLKKKDNITLDCLSVGTEANLTGNTNSALVGASFKLSDNLSVSAGAVINKNIGVQAKAVYSF